MRTAGSHGIADVIAIGPQGVRFIQVGRVKKDNSYTSKIKSATEEMREINVPPGVSLEIWIWRDYKGWEKQIKVK